jgi:hypothetical protein
MNLAGGAAACYTLDVAGIRYLRMSAAAYFQVVYDVESGWKSL